MGLIKKEILIEYMLNIFIVIFIISSLVLELKLDSTGIVSQPLVVIEGIFVAMGICINFFYQLNTMVIKKVTMVAAILFVFILFNSVVVRNYFLFGAIFNLVISVFIAKQIGVNKAVSTLYLIPYWLLVSYILMRLSIDPNPNSVFLRSRNYISFFLIIAVAPYYYSKLNQCKPASIIPAIILFLLCVYSLGRSGTFASVIILIAVALSKNISKKFLIVAIFLTVILITGIYFYAINTFEAAAEYQRLFTLLETLQSGARGIILSNYIKHSDWISVIFGMDTDQYKILNFGGSYLPSHVHSSVLNFVSVTGISSVLFFFYIFKTIFKLYKVNLPLMLLLVAIILRIITETGLMFGYFDYILWMFLFYNYNHVSFYEYTQKNTVIEDKLV